MQGILEKMNADRGYGFVREGKDSYFLHARAVEETSDVPFGNACIGNLVDFTPNHDDPKGAQATHAMITERPEGDRRRGTIRTWNTRGFAFVKAEDGHEHFCHATVCDFNPANAVGQAVTFELIESTNGKTACVNVRKATDESPDELQHE